MKRFRGREEEEVLTAGKLKPTTFNKWGSASIYERNCSLHALFGGLFFTPSTLENLRSGSLLTNLLHCSGFSSFRHLGGGWKGACILASKTTKSSLRNLLLKPTDTFDDAALDTSPILKHTFYITQQTKITPYANGWTRQTDGWMHINSMDR